MHVTCLEDLAGSSLYHWMVQGRSLWYDSTSFWMRKKVSFEFYVCIFSPSICCSSGHQSITKPSPCIIEASSIQNRYERTWAFSHHSDVRPACGIWVRLTCMRNSVWHACKWWNPSIKRSGKPFSQPTSHFSIKFLEKTAPVRQLLQAAWSQLLH